MTIDRIIFAFAGFMIFLGLFLGLYVHPYGFGLVFFVAANMFQAAFTGFCLVAIVLKKIGVTPGRAFY
jgi:hypothetical protein